MTAAQWNTLGRDNFYALAPGVAATAGSWIVTNGYNTLIERTPAVQYIGTSGSTDSTSYTDLSSAGATVTVATGPKALVSIGCQIANNTAGKGGKVGVAVTGASSITETDHNCFYANSANANDAFKGSWTSIYDATYVAGTNTFTLKYRALGSGIATFSGRLIMIVPF